MAGDKPKGNHRGDDPGKKSKKKNPKKPPVDGATRGRARRDAGCEATARHHRAKVLLFQMALLRAILKKGHADADDAATKDEKAAKFIDPNWRGAAVLGLLGRKWIRRAKHVEPKTSDRPWRHGTRNPFWEATDRGALPAQIKQLEAQLAALESSGGDQ